MTEKTISIVVPCYNEQESVYIFYKEIVKLFSNNLTDYNYELIYINDGSKDNTLKEILKISDGDENVKYISFSRNFGKESALYAGLENATGDYIAVMDVDLQDPPEMIIDMVKGIEEDGYDVVGCRRTSRKGEPPIRSFFAKQFYKIINKITDTEIVDGARDFRLMTRQVVNSILDVSEYNRFSKGIFSWVGYNTKYLEYENVERVAGETSWNFWGLLKYSIDGIVAFSDAPLMLASFLGILSCFGSGLGIIWIIISKLLFGNPVVGWASLVCIILFMGGLNLLCMGVFGKYIGKIFTEVKNRPIYIVKETNIKKD